MSEMTPQKVAEHLAQIPALAESQAELTKSLKALVDNQVANAEITKSKEDIEKSMEEKMEAKVAEITKSFEEKNQVLEMKVEEFQKSNKKQGQMHSGEISILEKAEVKEVIKKSLEGKTKIDSDILKSIVSFNNAGVGALQRELRNLGEIDINVQTSSPLVNLVNTVTSSSIKGVVYDTVDTSVLPPKENLEGMSPEQKKDIIKRGMVEIQPEQIKAWNYVTDVVMHGILAGDYRTNPIQAELRALEFALSKEIGRKMLNGVLGNGKGIEGIFPKSQEAGSKIAKVPTLATNTLTLQDVSLVVANLKADYLRGAVALIDRKALHAIYNEEANDGHLKIEYFDYSNGIARIRTAEGTFPLIAVESFPDTVVASQHDGFANYKSFVSSSQINSGYIINGSNSGKVYMVFANFGTAYTLTRSTTREVGIDNDFGDRLKNGLNIYGMIDYIGGAVVRQEAIAIGYIA